MKISDFDYDLPERLIAQLPLQRRSDSRLLSLNPVSGEIEDRQFTDLADLLQPGDLLVFNDTRVIPARLFGRKQSGGKVEVLVERVIDDAYLLAHIRASKSPRAGMKLMLEQTIDCQMTAREGELFMLRQDSDQSWLELLERHGHIPLPPYIRREDADQDRERYQTVYAQMPGAVAAPTAGLHFDQALIDSLEAKGINTARITLHVGAGTFQPVRVDDTADHVMHAERVQVSQAVCDAVERTRAGGGRVVAVGTTVVRSLEAAAARGELAPLQGESALFITPGYRFRVVDALITNFHLPKSTLLMLVSALAGFDLVREAYRHAVAQDYRFFSYGDAMYISCRADAESDLETTARSQE